MAATRSPSREGSTRRALPGLAGVLVLCACTLAGSVATPAGAGVLLSGSPSDTGVATSDPGAAPVPSSATPTPVPSGSGDPTSWTGPAPRTTPRLGTTDSRPRPASPVAEPTRVRLDGVDVAMPVIDVGVAADATMELPEDPDVAGWYRYSAAPGDDTGTTVLAAHVDSAERVGPLVRLAAAEAGNELVLETEEGRLRYTVTEVEQVERSELPTTELFDRGGEHRVVLITCGGPYQRGVGYRDNVVLTAVPRGR